jgi:hypothetical protein
MRIKSITMGSIPPVDMRYETVGDWEFLPGGHLKITTPDTLDDDSAFLVQLHELVEVYLCNKRGITDEEVTKWDIDHLAHPGEPGEIEGAPYFREHAVANRVEAIVCEELGLSWDTHDDRCGVADGQVTESRGKEKKPRHGHLWAELHLYALRHQPGVEANGWLTDWLSSWDAPSRGLLAPIIHEFAPDWWAFFNWTVDIHNRWNQYTGISLLSPDEARQLWTNRLF